MDRPCHYNGIAAISTPNITLLSLHFCHLLNMVSSCTPALVTALLLLGTCWVASGTPTSPLTRPLKVANRLEGNLTVENLPGCCSPCKPQDPPLYCPQICVKCRDVVMESGKEETLDTHVGPYPLESLKISTQGSYFCVRGGDLKLLVQSATLMVVSGGCGPNNSGLKATAMLTHIDELIAPPKDLCLIDCAL